MKVLIAEDDAVSRRLLRSYLEKWDHEVTEVADGAAALRLFHGGLFPLVISDWMMPELDGVELTRRIRSMQLPGYVYVILLTAKTQKQDLIEGMEAGADDFITKPFDRDELRVRLQAGERILRLERTLAEKNRALQEAQAALVQREKLASVGQLALGLAHELADPLSDLGDTIGGLRRDAVGALHILELYDEGRDALKEALPALATALGEAEQEINLPRVREEIRPMFDLCAEKLNHARDLVRNLGDFAHADEFLVRMMDPGRALAEVAAMVSRDAEKKQVRIQTDLAHTPRVQANPGKIKKVFLNLLSNAVEAVGPGGTILVRAATEDAGRVLIEVEDDGPGIPAENLPHLFDPFFTTKQRAGHAGLGLSIAYAIIREHGGEIEAVTPRTKGSLFRVRLPVQPTSPTGVAAGAREPTGVTP